MYSHNPLTRMTSSTGSITNQPSANRLCSSTTPMCRANSPRLPICNLTMPKASESSRRPCGRSSRRTEVAISCLLSAKNAKAAHLDIITWTFERSGRIVEEVLPTKGTASPEFYYQTTLDALHNDGDILVTLDVLARQVGILGIFTDWASTVTYYASCMNLK